VTESIHERAPVAVSGPSGFQGEVGSLPLADLLQVWSMNGFSGLVVVTSGGEQGRIWFIEGAIVHAEAAGRTGEAAFAVIVGWPKGSFDLHPNTASIARTIEKSVSHLLLDAHRMVDEARRGGGSPPPLPAPAAAPARPGLLDRVRALPGVVRLVRFGEDGRPAGGPDPGAEALAAKGLYLALNAAAPVGDAFDLRPLAIASLRGARESLILVQSSGQYLCVAVAPEAPLEPLVAQLRALLSRPTSR
jgi:hypothetical protein